jgi:hypothetical protein
MASAAAEAAAAAAAADAVAGSTPVMPQQHAQMYGDKSTARCRQGALGRGILSPGTTIGVSYPAPLPAGPRPATRRRRTAVGTHDSLRSAC